jgi:hypothetical protein
VHKFVEKRNLRGLEINLDNSCTINNLVFSGAEEA